MKKRTKEYIYKVGEIVNETLKIVEYTRVKDGKSTCKGYVVKSLVYPDDKNAYEISEGNLKKGTGCGYVRGLRIIEENSLYSHIEIRDNLIDVEQSKEIAPKSNKPVLFKCENKDCSHTKKITPNNLLKQGFACPICSTGVSYPELFFMSYNTIKNLNFIPEQRFNDFKGYIFDFVNYETRTIVETHGLAHYQEVSGHMNHKRTVKSDIAKREYCKENNWTLIELDCRYSNFDYIRNSILNNSLMENILDDEIEEIIILIEKNKRYPTKEICSLYLNEMLTTQEIANDLGLGLQVVKNVLYKNNVKTRPGGEPKRVVKCIETGKIYKSISEASRDTRASRSRISLCCNGKAKTAGGFHWEFVD